MLTPLYCDRRARDAGIGRSTGGEWVLPARAPRRLLRSGAAASAILAALLAIGGCSYTPGSIPYMLGLGRGQKVKAQFQLTRGPLLILIDDLSQRGEITVPTGLLFDDLAQELLKNKAAAQIIPQERIIHLRQSVPDFEKRGCREIGKQAGAEQVLWIEIQDFMADEQVQEAITAAYFSGSVKVVNVLEDGGNARVRLWPTDPEGYPVAVSMTASEVGLAKTRDAITKALVERLATEIARLFYDHRLGDFERAK